MERDSRAAANRWPIARVDGDACNLHTGNPKLRLYVCAMWLTFVYLPSQDYIFLINMVELKGIRVPALTVCRCSAHVSETCLGEGFGSLKSIPIGPTGPIGTRFLVNKCKMMPGQTRASKSHFSAFPGQFRDSSGTFVGQLGPSCHARCETGNGDRFTFRKRDLAKTWCQLGPHGLRLGGLCASEAFSTRRVSFL